MDLLRDHTRLLWGKYGLFLDQFQAPVTIGDLTYLGSTINYNNSDCLAVCHNLKKARRRGGYFAGVDKYGSNSAGPWDDV